MKLNKNRSPRQSRSGAAVVEFAVCLPVIMLIVLGSIEGASMLFLKQTLVQASYEGAKIAISDSDQADVVDAIEAVAAGRRINGLAIEFTPSSIANAAPGETITVTVTAPGDSNSFIPFGPFKNKTVVASASMVKE
jgi:Flp pilus assembly protein TadG